jgi:hypothetical protein
VLNGTESLKSDITIDLFVLIQSSKACRIRGRVDGKQAQVLLAVAQAAKVSNAE